MAKGEFLGGRACEASHPDPQRPPRLLRRLPAGRPGGQAQAQALEPGPGRLHVPVDQACPTRQDKPPVKEKKRNAGDIYIYI